MEDQTLRNVHYYLKFAATPPKHRHLHRVKRYLQPQHGLFLSADNVLLAPSAKEFSTTPRYVVPQAALQTVISIFHHQFGCLAVTPLKTLLRRHFFAFEMDKAIQEYVSSCIACAAKKDQSHTKQPMSSVPPPHYFGEQFAADVVKREKQKILLLRETATSFTWTTFIKNERAATLEAGLRRLFAEVRPPNAMRPSVCRVDNATAFQSLSDNKVLLDIGVSLDLSNKANKNGNPVAEKAVRELHDSLVTLRPGGGKVNSNELQTATAQLNSKPRWSSLSAIELWTGRDMVTGESLLFEQQDIIRQQAHRREMSHPKDSPPVPTFSPGQIVFCNSERSKLKARDKLIIREDLQNGMYRLDRVKESGRITRAFLPARDLYKYDPRATQEQEQTQELSVPTFPEQPDSDKNNQVQSDNKTNSSHSSNFQDNTPEIIKLIATT